MAFKDLEESGKNTLLARTEARVQELEKERLARIEIAQKLAQIEQKLLVGGVNMLDHHEKQRLMLAKKVQELEEKARKERALQKTLIEHDEINLQTEEQFSNLLEEAAAKTKKINTLWSKYQSLTRKIGARCFNVLANGQSCITFYCNDKIDIGYLFDAG